MEFCKKENDFDWKKKTKDIVKNKKIIRGSPNIH
jgi:hypothetical protein